MPTGWGSCCVVLIGGFKVLHAGTDRCDLGWEVSIGLVKRRCEKELEIELQFTAEQYHVSRLANQDNQNNYISRPAYCDPYRIVR